MLELMAPILKALALTVLIEVPAAWLLGVRDRVDLALTALINCVTNPIVNFLLLVVNLFAPGGGAARIAVIAVLEIGAVVSEGLFYRRSLAYRKLHPMLLSLILNGLSFGLGLLIL